MPMARLLVVEDDPDARDLIAMRLVLAGHRVVAIPNAAWALDTVECVGAPDAYVLDVGLPDIDGFELLERLRDRADPGVPAIFLTAFTGDNHVARGKAMGAQYLTKPFRAQSLINAVDAAVTSAPDVDPMSHGW
jgi:DNA-binding response OmpR family regulator